MTIYNQVAPDPACPIELRLSFTLPPSDTPAVGPGSYSASAVGAPTHPGHAVGVCGSCGWDAPLAEFPLVGPEDARLAGSDTNYPRTLCCYCAVTATASDVVRDVAAMLHELEARLRRHGGASAAPASRKELRR